MNIPRKYLTTGTVVLIAVLAVALSHDHNFKVDIVHSTADALTEVERDASVGAVLV